MLNEQQDAICARHDLDLLPPTSQIVIAMSSYIFVVTTCCCYLQLTSIRVHHLCNKESNAIAITQGKQRKCCCQTDYFLISFHQPFMLESLGILQYLCRSYVVGTQVQNLKALDFVRCLLLKCFASMLAMALNVATYNGVTFAYQHSVSTINVVVVVQNEHWNLRTTPS